MGVARVGGVIDVGEHGAAQRTPLPIRDQSYIR